MDMGNVVDQQIQLAAFALDAFEQRPHLLIVAMVTGHGDTPSARRVDGIGRALQVTLQGLAIERRAALPGHPPCDVHGHARLTQCLGNTAPDTATGACDQCYLWPFVVHAYLPVVARVG